MPTDIGSPLYFFSLSLARICSAPSSEDIQSQMPSQASMRNASFCCLGVLVTYGSTVTIYSLKSFAVFDLYSKSPIERDKLRLPFTLFSSTKPPAAMILLFSSSLSGLWSNESSASRLPWPDLPTIDLESPAFAHQKSVLVTSTTVAVHPVNYAILSSRLASANGSCWPQFELIFLSSALPSGNNSMSSIYLNASLSALS